MLKDLEVLKHQSPQLQILMTAKADDQFIGSDTEKIATYYNRLPVIDSNKWLLASPATSSRADINHVSLHNDVKLGWHSFLNKSGASYYNVPEMLKKGDTILDKAREQQRNLGMEHYLINAFDTKDLDTALSEVIIE